MKRALLRIWPYIPFAACMTGCALSAASWPWIAGMLVSLAAVVLWEAEWPVDRPAPGIRARSLFERRVRARLHMPRRHPESVTRRLSGDEEELLAALQDETWPDGDQVRGNGGMP